MNACPAEGNARAVNLRSGRIAGMEVITSDASAALMDCLSQADDPLCCGPVRRQRNVVRFPYSRESAHDCLLFRHRDSIRIRDIRAVHYPDEYSYSAPPRGEMETLVHIASLMPQRISHALTGKATAKPTIMAICMESQNVA